MAGIGTCQKIEFCRMQVIIDFLPGYYWDGQRLLSTGVALNPTQHISKKNGEIIYYVKPIGWTHSLYIRHKGISDYVDSLSSATPARDQSQ